MTQEERQLLLTDLCARLPYRVICRKDCKTADNEDFYLDKYPNPIELAKYLTIDDMDITIKPYLRPMSSMTEKEKEELYHYYCKEIADNLNTPNLTWQLRCCVSNSFGTDWLNAHHFDYRNLIEKGLAIEAPMDMYKIK